MSPIDPQRRQLLALLTLCPLTAMLPQRLVHADARGDGGAALAELERRHGGRLGVYVLDGARPDAGFGHREDERFGMCSTFKLLLAAAVLREADHGRLDLDESIHFEESDLVPHAPVVAAALTHGRMSIAALAEAAQISSDNAAANLLLRRLGGPAAFTALLRGMGDGVTRLDRIEPALNLVPPGELRDTTTPRAMAQTVLRLFGGDLLSASAQQRLKAWMIATRTGLQRLRAGLPADWEVGDKTGTGIAAAMPNKHNDVAVVWRAQHPPLVISAYYEADAHYPGMRAQDDALLAQVGRMAASLPAQQSAEP